MLSVLVHFFVFAGPMFIVGRHAYFQLFVIDPRVNYYRVEQLPFGHTPTFVGNHKIAWYARFTLYMPASLGSL